MKTLIPSLKTFLFALVMLSFAACKSNEKTDTRDIQLLADSTAYTPQYDTAAQANALMDNGNVNATHKTVHHSSTTHSTSNSGNSNNGNNVGTSNTSNNGTSTTQGTQKKGWSKAAQGAVIGGAAGAVGGAIISKNKGTGAAVGAVVGATGGYIIGRSKDKKDGRVKQ